MMENSLPFTITKAAYKEAGKDYEASAHTTTDFQWYCVVLGKVDYWLEEQPYRLKDGRSLITFPGELKHPRGTGTTVAYCYVNFTVEELDLTCLHQKPLPVPSIVQHDFIELVTELQSPSVYFSNEIVKIAFGRILLFFLKQELLARSDPVSRDRYKQSNNEKYEAERTKIIDLFLQRNLHKNLDRAAIANSVNLSVSQASLVFKKQIGMTIMQRLTQLRVQRACDLLLNSSQPIAQIVLDVGYSSFSHFSQVFRSHAGMSPSDYRRLQGLERIKNPFP